jgi:hypothetical protein
MTASLTTLLLRQSEAAERPILTGGQASPHFGRRLDRLIELGVLVELPPATEWDVCDSCECGADARITREVGGQMRALCLLDPANDAILEPDDLRAFRIETERLVSLIADASGFEGRPELLAADVWRIGRLASGRLIVVGISTRVLDQPGIVLLLKAAAGGAPVTVLTPEPAASIRLRFLEAGIDLVELRSALVLGPSGIDRLDWDTLEPRTEGPRLSIHLEAQAVLIDGTPQRVPSQPFTLLALLARAIRDGKGPVRNRAIEDATGRDARDLVRELRDALSAGRSNGSELRDWIEARRSLGAYALVLECEEIVVAP